MGQNMLVAIETAILDLLGARDLQVRDIDIDKLKAGIIHPAVFVSTEEGSFTKEGQKSFRCGVRIFLVVVFHNVKGEKERRQGLYPIVLGITGLLMLKTLGLDIAPIRPVRFRNVTTEAFRKMNLCAYEIELATAFSLKAEDQELADELLRIGLNYYLQDPADDHRADAGDVVELIE
jgi:hypothetical protein